MDTDSIETILETESCNTTPSYVSRFLLYEWLLRLTSTPLLTWGMLSAAPHFNVTIKLVKSGRPAFSSEKPNCTIQLSAPITTAVTETKTTH